LLLIPAFAMVAAFAIFLLALIRPPTRPAALTGFYLLAYANIVFVGQIANTIYQLNSQILWLALHFVLAGGGYLAWCRAGKPSLCAPWLDQNGRFFPSGWRASFKNWPDIWVLGAGVTVVFLFSALLIWIVPPNNNDSLATHMSRVAYWYQHGAFFPWPTHRIWQITYPVNMQLQAFWTFLFLGNDRIVEIVQWLSAVAALPAVFGLSRLLHASRPQAFFAAFVWATFPEIILESTTTQNDLVAGTLFAIMFYLLFLGLRNRHAGTVVLSGLAMGLGMGTKQTLFFLIPGLIIIIIIVLIINGRASQRSLMIWAASSAAAFLLVGVYMFVVNQIQFGHPMGPETAVSAQTGGQTRQSLVDNITFNSVRLFYQFIDPTGLPDPLTGYSFKAKALVVGKLAGLVGFPIEDDRAVAVGHRFILRDRHLMQEDAAWYGPLFALLGLPALFYHFIVGIQKKDLLRVGIFVLAASFLLVNAALRPGWDPAQGRYFIPVVTISSALIAFAARPGRRWAAARWVMVIVALTIASNTFLLNEGKPVTGPQNIWSAHWTTQQTQQSFYMRHVVRFVEANVPADASIGLINYGTYLEYPFFRDNYSRRLVQIDPPERVYEVEWLKEQGVEFVLLQAAEHAPAISLPEDLIPIANLESWTLFVWKTK
jgi:4-amino-4-deoxy-L-arabinose transferase-like glycosyltransferase